MVDSDRLVTAVRENALAVYPEDTSSLAVKKGWYFSSSSDYAAWSGSTTATISRQSGKMIVSPLTKEPENVLSNVPDVDLYDVTYVRVRMKGNTSSCGGSIKWTTDTDNTFDDIKRTYMETPPSIAKVMSDYYIPVGKSVKRNGHLTGLKLLPGRILDKSQKFEIESIELLSDTGITNGAKVVSTG